MSDLVLTDKNFSEEVFKSQKPVLVDFWAEWCMPCQMITPIIQEIADEFGEKIKIGTPKSRHFRLLECLLEPFGKAKTIETVYEWIKLPKDKKDSDLSGWDNYKKKSRQIIIIQNAIKELQKGNKLRGKLAFEFDDTKSKIWIEYLE